MSMIFDEKTHTYRKEETILPSVSRILECNPIGESLHKYLADGNVYPQDKLEEAQNWGKLIHSLIVEGIEGHPFEGENTVKDVKIKRLLKYANKEINKTPPLAYEIPMISSVYGFGGTPDLFGDMGSRVARLKDWKTNEKTKSKFIKYSLDRYSAQLGGYFILAVENIDDLFKRFGFNNIDFIGDIVHLDSETTMSVQLPIWASNFAKLLDIYKGEEYKGIKVRNVIELWNAGMQLDTISNILGIDHQVACETIIKFTIY